MKIKTITTSTTSLLLMLAVILSSAHAKDIMRTNTIKSRNVAKMYTSDDGLAKVHPELHNHIDKQTLKMLYHNGDIQQRTDRRSLWVLENEARSYSAELKVGAALWFRLLAAKLMI